MEHLSKIHLAIVDDHLMLRENLTDYLEKDGEFEVTYSAGNGIDIFEQIEYKKEEPEICVLDIDMPNMDGFATLRKLRQKYEALKVLVFTGMPREGNLARMMEMGFEGYLIKTCGRLELVQALRKIAGSGYYFSSALDAKFISSLRNGTYKMPTFTDMEHSILRLFCQYDLTYSDIAEMLETSKKSVEDARDRLFRKLNVNNRMALVYYAIQFGIVTDKEISGMVKPKIVI